MGPLLVSSGDSELSSLASATWELASMGPLLVSSGDVSKPHDSHALWCASMGPLLVSSGDVSYSRRGKVRVARLQWGRCW